MATVLELNYYPVKGCAGISVSDALVTSAGLIHDRTFMVVEPSGVFRSQRRDPRLALVHPCISADGYRLTLRAAGFGAVEVDVALGVERSDVELLGKAYRGIDQGGAVARWLSEFLGAPCRLMRVPPEHTRVTDGETPGTCGYADSSPLLLTAMSSLEALNRRITRRGGEPVLMNRFRPNIVVDGWDEPHREDRARRIEIGDVGLAYGKLAGRCVVTTVDQMSGTRLGPEPLRTLTGYRRVPAGRVVFGVKFAVVRPGRLSLGDEVAVTVWADARLDEFVFVTAELSVVGGRSRALWARDRVSFVARVGPVG